MKPSIRRFIALIAFICATAVAGVAQAQSDSALPPVNEAPEQIAPPPNPVIITADRVEHEVKSGDASAEGNVRIVYGKKTVTGDAAIYNQNTGDGAVEGNARFTDPKTSISAEVAQFNSFTTLGTLYRFYADFERQYFIRGSRIEKLGEDHYQAEDCFLTTCDQQDPDWEFSASDADVTIEGYAFLKNAVFRAGGWPILYLPYMVAPAKVKRVTGFLVPSPAYSSAFGFQVQNQFFWAIAENQDATFSHNYLGQAGNKLGLEYRYILSPTTLGTLNAEYLMETDPDKSTDRNLWRALYDHRQTLPWDVSAVAHINKESEGMLSREYGSSVTDRAKVYTDSYVTFTKNWGSSSLLLMTRELMTLDTTTSDSQVVRKLPELKFTNQKEQLWETPFYGSIESSFASFRTETGSSDTKAFYGVERADFSPVVSLPIPIMPYLSAEAVAGYRSTWYSKGVDPATGETIAQSFTRNLYNLAASLTGPKTFQVFDTDSADTPKLKHLITPKLSWSYTPGMEVDGDNRTKVAVIDNIDKADPANLVTFQLSNDLLAKKALSQELSQTVSLATLIFTESYNINEANRTDIQDDAKRPFSSTGASLITRPANWLTLNYATTYNFYESLWDSSSLGLGTKYEDSVNFALDRAYKWGGGAGKKDAAWDTAYLEVKLPWWRMTVDYSVIYNETEGFATNSMARLKYRKECWGFSVSYEQRGITRTDADGTSRQMDESRTMFTLTLIGLGDALGGDQPPLVKPKL
jgi:LPS-assembly protein